jgi:ribosomal protein S18 acetylase RimI-like enzyme
MARGCGHSIEVQRLSPDDWKIWRDLRLQALAEAPFAFSSTLADWQGRGDQESRWRARLSTVPFNIAGYLDRREAGMVSATAPEDEITELISMWVAPAARGRGMGYALIAAVIQWAAEQRARRVMLRVFERNGPAINLYRRHGFVDAGAVEGTGSASPVERIMRLDLRATQGQKK